MYIDTMQQIYTSVNKVLVDSRQGSNLLYLPLDKLMQQVSSGNAEQTVVPGTAPNATTTLPGSVPVPGLADGRSRDGQRSRDRDGR